MKQIVVAYSNRRLKFRLEHQGLEPTLALKDNFNRSLIFSVLSILLSILARMFNFKIRNPGFEPSFPLGENVE